MLPFMPVHQCESVCVFVGTVYSNLCAWENWRTFAQESKLCTCASTPLEKVCMRRWMEVSPAKNPAIMLLPVALWRQRQRRSVVISIPASWIFLTEYGQPQSTAFHTLPAIRCFFTQSKFVTSGVYNVYCDWHGKRALMWPFANCTTYLTKPAGKDSSMLSQLQWRATPGCNLTIIYFWLVKDMKLQGLTNNNSQKFTEPDVMSCGYVL